MSYITRLARPTDRATLAEWTRDTFSWGDYVSDRFDEWLDDPAGITLVAVDDADHPIAIGRCRFLSPTEGWLSAARVHPDHRRAGIASQITEELVAWAAGKGALVVRLVIEDWNEGAISQVEQTGFRRVAAVTRATRDIGAAAPSLSGNGGRRARAREPLGVAPPGEAEPAFVAWSAGPLSRAMRGMFAIGWTWRRLTIEDMKSAARQSALWAAGTGWVMGATAEDRFEVGWCDTTPDNAIDLARGIADLSQREGADKARVMLPTTEWLDEAFADTGYELKPMAIYARGL